MNEDAQGDRKLHPSWTGVENIDAAIDELIEWLFEPVGTNDQGETLYQVRKDIK